MASTPEEKRAQLARLLREKARKPRQAPASFSQERMWFLDQWNPGSALFNMPVAVRLTGELNLEALERGLQELVNRHEPLRTTLLEQEGTPVQLIAPSVEVPLTRVDLQEHPEAEREAQAWKHISAEAQRPFELSKGPMLRTVLYRLSPREHLLLFNLHHAIADGWSMGVLVRELATLYPAFLAGRPSPLPTLPLQYAEYAGWQREWLQGEVLESQLAFWRSKLDPNAVLELPGDKPRPPALSSQGVRQSPGALAGAHPGPQGACPARGQDALRHPAGRLRGAAPALLPGRRT